MQRIQNIPNVELLRAKQGTKFTFQMNAEERAQAARDHTALLDQAFAQTEHLRLLVLDEIMAACSTGMVNEEHLIDLLLHRPQGLEVVMTGRNPSDRLLELAGYVTEMRKIKHPYEQGIAARRGIER